MKKLFYFFIAIAFMGKMEAQQKFDFESNGIAYNLMSISEPPYWQLEAVGITENIQNLSVPSHVTHIEQVFEVVEINMVASGEFSELIKQIKKIIVPNTVTSIKLNGLTSLENLNIPNSVAKIELSSIESLTILDIPNSVNRLGYRGCNSLKTLFIQEGDGILYVNTEYPYSISPQNAPDTTYCDRNMKMGGKLGKVIVIGDNVSSLDCAPCNIFDKLTVPSRLNDVHNTFHGLSVNELVIEDSSVELSSSSSWYVFGWLENGGGIGLDANKIYFGREIKLGVSFIHNFGQITIGPLVNNIEWQLSEEGNNGDNINIIDSAFIKIYNRRPPDYFLWNDTYSSSEITHSYYQNVPLFVPRGSLESYRNSDWGRFFNIVEFDWDGQWSGISYSINAESNNTELGTIEGGGDYCFGATVTLKAIPSAEGQFQNWTENGVIVCLDEFYTFVADRDRSLVANFGGTGVEENEGSTKFYAFTKDKTIFVEGLDTSSEVAVYNIQGQSIYKGLDRIITVPYAGVYIVAVENRRIKVVVE